MIRMINKLTNTEMWVAENRVEEYKAAGHKLAASFDAVPTVEAEQEEVISEADEAPEEVTVSEDDPEEFKEEKKDTKKSTKKK